MHKKGTNLDIKSFKHNPRNWVWAKFIWDKIVKQPLDQWCAECRTYLHKKKHLEWGQIHDTWILQKKKKKTVKNGRV